MGGLRSRALAAAAAALITGAGLPSRVAVAQEAEEASASADARARQLFLDGDEAYAAGDYERAASRFLRAYELSGRPALLFNLGNAYERMGAYERAAEALRRYLDRTDARDREAIEQRIARLEEAHRRRQEEIARLEALGGERDDGQKPAPEPPPAPAERVGSAPGGDESRAYLWVGGGGVAVAGGLIFGLVSHASGNQAASRCSEVDGARLCPGSARSALARERGFAIAADVSVVLGLGAAGVGGYMLWKQRGGEPERGLAIAPAVLSDAIGIGVRGGF